MKLPFSLPFDVAPWLDFLDPPMPPLLGVDIGTSSVKVVALSRRKTGELVYEGHAIENLPTVALGKIDWSENDPAINSAIADTIRSAVAKVRRRSRTPVVAAINIPSLLVRSKRIEFNEQLEEEDAEAEAHREITRGLASTEDMHVDWAVLGPSSQMPSDIEAFVCAARRPHLIERQGLGEQAGLQVRIIDVDTFASQRAFERAIVAQQLTDKTCAIVDAGARMTHISFVRGGETLGTRTIQYGGESLLEALSRSQKLPREAAIAAVSAPSEPFPGYESTYAQPVTQNLANEISRACEAFMQDTPDVSVDLILIGGGGARILGLAAATQERSGVESRIVDLLAGIEVGAKTSRRLSEDAPMLTVALGLALRRFDGEEIL